MALTKFDIMEHVAKLGFSKKKSKEIIETLLELIKSSLENGEDVLVSGFGKIQVKDKAPRKGRNPAGGEEMMLEGRKVVTFKISGKLREKVNGGRKD